MDTDQFTAAKKTLAEYAAHVRRWEQALKHARKVYEDYCRTLRQDHGGNGAFQDAWSGAMLQELNDIQEQYGLVPTFPVIKGMKKFTGEF